MKIRIIQVFTGCLPLLSPVVFSAPSTSTTQTLIVAATPDTPPLSELDTPAAVSVVYGEDLRQAHQQINLSEGLSGVPGLQVANRQNYAQDLQMSIRGFGARSTFGVRGLRIYVDDIPATMPDGQGQTSNVDIGSIDHIDVLRGPFSALYGNSSGGVIAITTARGTQPPTLGISSNYSSFGTWRNSVSASGSTGDGSQKGDVDYHISGARMTTHGFRHHSDAQKTTGNAKLGVQLDEVSHLTLNLNSVHLDANDPGGLTRAMWKRDPHQVASNVSLYDARKSVDQTQAGLHYTRQLTENDSLAVTTWAGMRQTTQYQSIPAATQRSKAHHAGGVIDLTRHYQGIDTRWTHTGQLFSHPVSLTTGIDYETMREQRKGYENFRGSGANQQLGVLGRLRRDEQNQVWNIDPYLQSAWQLTDKLSFNAGVRFSRVHFDSHDHYITATNGDDSGKVTYHQWLPAFSLNYAHNASWKSYLSFGRGFETPTLNELSYRPDGGAGLNLALKPSTSHTLEIGTKNRIGLGLMTAALFQTDTDNEIVTSSNNDGRSTYKNAGQTRRRGVELDWQQQFAGDWHVGASWTLLDARYRSQVCDSGCEGNRIPGVAKNMFYTHLEYQPISGWYAGTDLRYLSKIAVNDTNSEYAPAWTVTGIYTGYKWDIKQWNIDISGRIDNLFDRQYSGSVIVNEGNGRFYEPAPGRNYSVGLNVSYAFE
ncbi:TonB-dependent receptor [Tatumella ptyseos]|uniref:TonB-dependent receptor n=1 Tax=Tatumella ptyseos TaxID=82987 RepID=UPI0026F30F53|nr:TonB-dependent receptor [Tatumella ptyseos]WKX27882.1 TonB-dependent receptor [Tatumella ptyseos]